MTITFTLYGPSNEDGSQVAAIIGPPGESTGVSILRYGAVMDGTTDDSAAVQACFDYCRDRGLSWYVPDGDCYLGSAVTAYTGGRCEGRFLVANDGDVSAWFNVAPVAADKTALSAETVDAWTFITKGTSESAELGDYDNHVVWWYTVDELAIDRFDSSGLRYQETIIVGEGGKFYPSITHTKLETWSAVEAYAVRIREPITIDGLQIRATTGAVESEVFVNVTRPNTRLIGVSVSNATAAPVRTGIRFSTTGAIGSCTECDVEGLGENQTNYAYHVSTADVTFTNCRERGARRGLDGQGSKFIRVIGGSYPDGIGAHWNHGMHVSGGAYISADSPNTAPLFYSGGDLTVTGCRLRVPTEMSNLFAVRGDLFELTGSLRIEDNDIEIDVSTNLSTARVLVRLNEGSTTDGHDWGRLVYLPDLITFKGNRVRQIGASYTGRTRITSFGSSRSWPDGLSGGGRIEVSGNAWRFDGGDASYLLDFVVAKDSLWNSGTGYNILIKDVPSIQVYSFCATARSDNNQRCNWTVEADKLFLQLSPGAAHVTQYSSPTSTVTPIGSGRTTPAGDEIEARLGPIRTARATWNIPSTSSGAMATTTITVPGVGAGMIAVVGLDDISSASLPSGWIVFAQVTAADTVTVAAYNGTGGTSDPSSLNLRVRVV